MSESARPRAAVVGAVNTDLVVRCDALPRPGETVLAGDVERLPGGKGGNQAAALATLGVHTTVVSCVGRDELGEWLLATLEATGADTSLVQRSARPTGTAFITVDAAGENEIVVSRGANADLDLAHVDLDPFNLVLAQMEVPTDVVDELARRTSTLVLNVAPARPVAAATLRRCAVVIANEIEAQALELRELAHCVVTRGSRGAVHYSFGEVVAEVVAPVVDAIDTVGAGDVFCAAYASRYLTHDSPEDSLRFAVTAGALATLARGAQGSLPTTEEVEQWLARAS
jgi:ribokinase